MKREHDAHAALNRAANLRCIDLLRGEINMERRKASIQDYGERQQRLIEAGLWPVYTP